MELLRSHMARQLASRVFSLSTWNAYRDNRIPARHTSSRTIRSQRGVDTRKTGAAIFSRPLHERAQPPLPQPLGARRGKAYGRVTMSRAWLTGLVLARAWPGRRGRVLRASRHSCVSGGHCNSTVSIIYYCTLITLPHVIIAQRELLHEII